MRRIGSLTSESDARRFGDYLLVHDVDNRIDAEDDGTWSIWVHSEDQVADARDRFAHFRQHPGDDRYDAATKRAKAIRGEREKAAARSRSRMVDVRTTWGTRGIAAAGRVTIGLMTVSIVVALAKRLGLDTSFLYFASFEHILAGQVWRLFTPVFLHFGLIHILFNLYWLYQLGGMVEHHQGSRKLFLLVLVAGIGGNVAQYIVSGPLFGGMSGVVYGLFGYVWIRSRHDASSGLVMHPTTGLVMLVWFALCWTGAFGPIANWAHAGGLVAGVLWAWIDSGRPRLF